MSLFTDTINTGKFIGLHMALMDFDTAVEIFYDGAIGLFIFTTKTLVKKLCGRTTVMQLRPISSPPWDVGSEGGS